MSDAISGVLPVSEAYLEQAQVLAAKLGLVCLSPSLPKHLSNDQLFLCVSDRGVELQSGGKKAPGAARVDFDTGALFRRMKSGDGLLSKATGIKPSRDLHILDATAGFGVDSFMMASMGAKVTLLERNPIVAEMLADGIARGLACEHLDVAEALSRMTLAANEAGDYLEACAKDDHTYSVVYLDPMFPERKKSALVKKEMQYFHQIVGPDLDADALLAKAMKVAEYRVVVKRPRVAPFLADAEPNLQISGKAHRFDVYTIKALP